MCIYQNKAIIFKIYPPHMLATVFPSLFRDLGPAVTLSALFLVAAGASGREMHPGVGDPNIDLFQVCELRSSTQAL